MTVSAYEISDPDKFLKDIKCELKKAGALNEAQERFCRRYHFLRRINAYICHAFAVRAFEDVNETDFLSRAQRHMNSLLT